MLQNYDSILTAENHATYEGMVFTLDFHDIFNEFIDSQQSFRTLKYFSTK